MREFIKNLSIFFLLLTIQKAIGQNNIKLYYEMSKTRDSITYFVDNLEIFPASISFSNNPTLENMRFETPFQKKHVLKPESTKNKIATFILVNKTKKWGVKMMPSFRTFIGDITIVDYDKDYLYDLPYSKGDTFEVYQGYNGNFSHQNENALDFTMPEGTPILAARAGMVIGIVQKNKSGCPTKNCADQGNYVKILHSDGTIADYFHLKFNGARVSLGQNVEKGELIGLSGNTGWSNGPHLHFVVYLPSDLEENKWRKTLPTLFRINNSSKGELLKPKTKYTKNY